MADALHRLALRLAGEYFRRIRAITIRLLVRPVVSSTRGRQLLPSMLLTPGLHRYRASAGEAEFPQSWGPHVWG